MPEEIKEIEKVVDNEMEKQNVSLSDDQKKAIADLVNKAVTSEVTGGIDRKTAVNVGTHIAVALLSAGATVGIARVFGWRRPGEEVTVWPEGQATCIKGVLQPPGTGNICT